MKYLPVIIGALAFALAGAPSGAASLLQAPVPDAAAGHPYILSPDDQLSINVMGHADLSAGSVVILPDGTFNYPIVGTVHAAGLTLAQLTQAVTRGLSDELNQPQVTITVGQRQVKEVSVLGAVKTPGKHVLKDGWHVLDVIADCGGLSVDQPEWASATLVRGGVKMIPIDLPALMKNADPKQNILLQPDDVLLIQERDPSKVFIQVLGEASKTGFIPVPKDDSLNTVLTQIGGPTPKALLSKATIERGDKTIPVDLRSFRMQGKLAEDVKVEPGDTLVIPQNNERFGVFVQDHGGGYIDYPDDQPTPLTVLSALSLAGAATTSDADLKNTVIIRSNKTGPPTMLTVNVEDILKKGDLSKDIRVQPDDILFLPSKKHHSPITLNSVLSALPFVSLFAR